LDLAVLDPRGLNPDGVALADVDEGDLERVRGVALDVVDGAPGAVGAAVAELLRQVGQRGVDARAQAGREGQGRAGEGEAGTASAHGGCVAQARAPRLPRRPGGGRPASAPASGRRAPGLK